MHVVQLIISDDPQGFFLSDSTGALHFKWFRETLIEDVRKQINGRCQDLLEVYGQDIAKVNDDPEDRLPIGSGGLPVVDFLHRSVKDYLQSGKLASVLRGWTGDAFDPARMLFACYVFMVKTAAPTPTMIADRVQHSITGGTLRNAIEWSWRALSHASDAPYDTLTRALMASLDQSMSRAVVDNHHWTNKAVAKPHDSARDIAEQGQRDFLGHSIEIGIASHALGMIKQDPTCLTRKDGRPYLDYALRFNDEVQHGAERLPIPTLVKSLLSYGLDVNQKVWICDGRTVWSLFLAFLYDIQLDTANAREVTWLLINHGADEVFQCEVAERSEFPMAKYRNVESKRKVLNMQQILIAVFGEDDAAAMCEVVTRNRKKSWASYIKQWCDWKDPAQQAAI